MDPSAEKKGFTLIELAVVLVVLGILITLGVALLGPLTKRIKINQTNDIIDAASESLVSYASSNKRLPTTTEFASAVRN
ncbi:MAG: prepilin-type N-terminal cleavage/methylation domain-containing protein, partial [Nitrospirae bacterium]